VELMPCEVCDNTGWVCEKHADRPSDCGDSKRPAPAVAPACHASSVTSRSRATPASAGLLSAARRCGQRLGPLSRGMPPRRFPQLRSIEELSECFIVCDASEALANVLFRGGARPRQGCRVLQRRFGPGVDGMCGGGPKQQRESGDPRQTDEKGKGESRLHPSPVNKRYEFAHVAQEGDTSCL
jgi:hypothetical protein